MPLLPLITLLTKLCVHSSMDTYHQPKGNNRYLSIWDSSYSLLLNFTFECVIRFTLIGYRTKCRDPALRGANIDPTFQAITTAMLVRVLSVAGK